MTTTEVPTFFGPADSPLFGVVHLPVDNEIRGGVLICGSLGKEGMDSARLHRTLADGLARLGFGVGRDVEPAGDASSAVADDAGRGPRVSVVCHHQQRRGRQGE